MRGVSPPTVPIAVPGSDDELSPRHARAVIDLALRVGEAMLSTGASAAEVVATVLRLTSAYGVQSAHVDITFTSITVSIHRGMDADPLSVMRVVRTRSPDHTRLERVQLLVDRVVGGGGPDVDQARAELAGVLRAPHPYRRWVTVAGEALLASAVVLLFGGGPAMMVLAALSATVVNVVSRQLGRLGIAAFFNQAVSAAIPTSLAVLLYWLRGRGVEVPGLTSPSLVVISGIVVLLAGLTAMGAAQDALDAYYVTAAARGLEVIMLTLGIAVGISLVLSLARRLGVGLGISPVLNHDSSLLTTMAAAVLIGVGFALSTYTGPRALLVAGAVAGLTWAVYRLVLLLELAPSLSVAVPAAVAGAAGYGAHRALRVPELAITTAAIVALLPGLAVYRALYLMMENPTSLTTTAITQLAAAVSIGLGLAAGVSIGGYAARRRFGMDRAAQRAARRAAGRARP